MPRRGEFNDLTGQHFGKLTTVEYHHKDSRRQSYWRCLCDCGREKIVWQGNLRHGKYGSCGQPGCLNNYVRQTDHMVGYTAKGEPFLIDEADLPAARGYTWLLDKRHGYIYAAAPGHVTIFLHKLLMGNPPDEVDHINLDKTDDRRANLRSCTTQQNSCNRRKRRGPHLSRYKGVTMNRTHELYVAQIVAYGRHHYLGTFTMEEEAALAYNRRAMESFGEFARLNEVR